MAQDELQHAALYHLRVTPDIILELMEGLSEEHAQQKATPTEYSLAEFLEYLSHREAHGFRTWLDLLLQAPADQLPTLPQYDRAGLFASGAYSRREPEESIAHWQERRDDNLELLQSLKQEDLSRQAVHPSVGKTTLNGLLCEWAAHDLMAVRQISEYVGAYLYIPEDRHIYS